MSRLAGLLLVVMGATAFADTSEPTATAPKPEEAAPAPKANKFPLRVVKILADSEQALLFDKNRGRHVLVDVGEAVGDYTVASITEDEVTLTGKDVPVEVILAAPETFQARKAKRAAKKAAAEAAAAEDVADTSEAAPEDPYDAKPATRPAPKAKTAPADPYADDEAVAETEEPARPIRSTSAKSDGDKSTTSPFATMDESAAKPSPDVADAGKADAKPATDGPTKLDKKAVTAALNDFGGLAASIDGAFTPAGLVVSKVQSGSLFAKAGLVPGDVIKSVDGRPLKSIDDAADLYARAGSMRTATIQLTRAGKPQTLRIAIQ